MARQEHEIVVIGASAGGIKPLQSLLAELPANYPGTIFVVVHIGAGQSMLPAILARSCQIPVSHALDGEQFKRGQVYIAPPDHHLIVHQESIQLSHGPRENRSRPAIDPLFRSAARAHGERVTAVILSGALSDGVTGLLAVKGRGGRVVVQDPEEALVEGMPTSALQAVEADYVLTAQDIGRLLAGVPMEPARVRKESGMDPTAADQERIKQDFSQQEQDRRGGEITMFTCPDCGGTLWQTGSGDYLHFRCHVGHVWGSEALLGYKSEEVEAALWSSVRLLEERATLSRQVAQRIRSGGRRNVQASAVEESADLDERRADAIRQLLSTALAPAFAAVDEDGKADVP